jgi:glycosyltransferase involved in cell wall biosynthesis
VVDQTPAKDRDTDLSADFADLPLVVFHLDRAGQCSSRNAGLKEVTGDYILFIDDDDEIPPHLIEDHLRGLAQSRAQVSSGVADEEGAGPLPEDFTYTRTSNVFPTNNTLVMKEVLRQSGLFDLAFDRGQRADHDLGMRIYLSGALMILSPEISVFHHHAPAGGLRTHKARIITYAGSRHRLGVRHLPSVTEFYLALRYFTPRQVREMFWLRAFGTFSFQGSRANATTHTFRPQRY